MRNTKRIPSSDVRNLPRSVTFFTALLPVPVWFGVWVILGKPVNHSFSLMLLPVLMAAWWGGWQAGITATLLGALGAWNLSTPWPPLAGWSQAGNFDVTGLSIFAATAILFNFILEQYRHSGGEVSAKHKKPLEIERSLIEQAPSGLAMFDTEMRYLAASQQWREMHRLADSEIIGHSHFGLVPEISTHWKAIHQRALAGETIMGYEDRFDRAGGPSVWVDWACSPWLTSSGTVGGIIIAAHDITPRVEKHKATESTLLEFKNTLDATHDCVFMFHPETLQFFYVNQGACEQIGFSKQELLELHPYDILPELPELKFRERLVPLLGDAKQSIRFETVQRHRDGHDSPVEVFIQLIAPSGEKARFVNINTDITERKLAEAEKRKNDNLLSNALTLAKAGHWSYDALSDTFTFNDNFYHVFGTTAQEMGGYTMSSAAYAQRFVYSEDAHLVGEEIAASLADPNPDQPHALEHRFQYTDGRIGHLAVRYSTELDASNTVVRFYGINQDITEKKSAQLELDQYRTQLEHLVDQRTQELTVAKMAAESASKVKSAFLAHMSHEIRTPMNAVLGLAQLLEHEPLTADQLEMVHCINESGHTLLNILNDILDLSKIEAEQIRIDHQSLTLAPILSQVDNLLRLSAEKKQLDLLISSPPTEIGALQGDPLRIEQVLVNLVSNAIKFTERGGVNLSVSVVSEDPQTVRLRFEVRDTGIGMTAETQKNLFKPFSQGDDSITRRFGGTGLGLSISRQLIKLMGGEMGFTSEHGRGSTFWFEVPLGRHSSTAPSSTSMPGTSSDTAPMDLKLNGLRVLAVDDSPINLMVLERALKHEGAKVTLAKDGAESLDILKAEPSGFDVVLMDIQMPIMDGLTATRAIRKNPALAGVPVIALTAGVLPEERQAALDAGVDEFLTKPLNHQQMTEQLVRYLP